jgi:hypothetical protein
MTTGTDLVKEIVTAYKYAPHVWVVRTNVYGRSLHVRGLPAGFADLLVLCRNGRAIFVETKSKNEKQRDAQKEFQERVTNLGYEYYTIGTRTEFDDIINNPEEDL